VNSNQYLRYTKQMAANMRALTERSAFVGLPQEKVGGQVYGGGASIIQIGAVHEYGEPSQGIPQRSWLRMPFRVNRDALNRSIAKQYRAVTNGEKSVDAGLNTIGAIAVNTSKQAFQSQGYGNWPDIDESTKERKGSSRVLVDTRLFSGSITWAVRG